MKHPVKISVLMPLYNCRAYVGLAIESILRQNYKKFDLIIIDDGSTDGSDIVVQEYAKKDARIRYYKNKQNMGIVYSLNKGIALCEGEYIARMDQDDIALPDRLTKQSIFLDSNATVVAVGGAVEYIDKNGLSLKKVRHANGDNNLLYANPLLHPTVMMRSKVLSENKLFYREDYECAEDYDLWLRLSRFGNIKSLDAVVLKYRTTENVMRFKKVKRVLIATLKVKYYGFIQLKIKPNPVDFLRAIFEVGLLLLPGKWIIKIYNKVTFGRTSI